MQEEKPEEDLGTGKPDSKGETPRSVRRRGDESWRTRVVSFLISIPPHSLSHCSKTKMKAFLCSLK
jgi:hypothetical protein